jgi:hypothetical protein
MAKYGECTHYGYLMVVARAFTRRLSDYLQAYRQAHGENPGFFLLDDYDWEIACALADWALASSGKSGAREDFLKFQGIPMMRRSDVQVQEVCPMTPKHRPVHWEPN